ncbi:hypothetical protein MILUP08_43344 [Micromonospora lupini str. Lupac 08]|uniref:Uncharacterized protein n=1 Tax=Micromonospora lupini str. Lupac 08 TaxID=1150864 RepID=I0L3N7_9ACTN|nr:hypothetical protein MILUP08_43344 [Micromonospora lupini str. Lupac 08]
MVRVSRWVEVRPSLVVRRGLSPRVSVKVRLTGGLRLRSHDLDPLPHLLPCCAGAAPHARRR